MNKLKEALEEFWLWLLELLGGAAAFLLAPHERLR